MGSGQSASSVADTSFYDLLGVEPNVSSAELQKAYKRKALRLHPDKGGDPDEFKKMKDAYDVLLNPDKRAAYDRYGPSVVGVMNGEPPTLDVIAAIINNVSKRQRALYVSGVVCVACFILSSPLLIALRWDGTTRESWAFAFLPLWIIQAVAICGLLLLPTRPDQPAEELDAEAKAMYERMRSMKVLGITCALILTAIEALLVAKLEGSFGGSWAVALCPLILMECFWLVCQGRGAKQAWTGLASSQPPPRLLQFLVHHFGWGAARLAAWVLVATRASDVWQGTWLVCLAPLLVCEWLRVCLPMRTVRIGSRVRLRGLSQEGRGSQLNGQDGQVVGVDSESGRFVVQLSGEESQVVSVKPENLEEEKGNACARRMIWLPWLLLGALKLDGWGASAFLVFLPIFVSVCCLTCCFSCVVALVTGDMLKEHMQPTQEGSQRDGDWPAATSDVPCDVELAEGVAGRPDRNMTQELEPPGAQPSLNKKRCCHSNQVPPSTHSFFAFRLVNGRGER